MDLRKCPLCQHKTAEIIEKGSVNKYEDGHFDHFHCESYYIACKACGYSVHKTNKTDAELAWNTACPTTADLQWYIDHGDRLLQEWETKQMWLDKND